MIIKKFLHSCILIEEGEKRLLMDPGTFSFVEGKIKPEDIGPVDVILITHKHPDHYFPQALKTILSLKPAKVLANHEIGALMEQDGIKHEKISPNETKTVEGFKIAAYEAPHGPIPAELPHNLAFAINDRLLQPGDSFDVHGLKEIEIVALPIAGPWARVVDALHFAKSLKPSHVIPIHDAIIKDFMLERMYAMCDGKLKADGISFHPIKIGEYLEL